jgi:valyl-tRNA synthetase
MRLLHPMVPFITEEVWQLLGQAAPERGLESPRPAAASIMIASWPAADLERQDGEIEARFDLFQRVLGGLREIRSRQNIPPKTPLEFVVVCQPSEAALLAPMEPYFVSMANARPREIGPNATKPATAASFLVRDFWTFVDLAGLVDVGAEIARREKELASLTGAIASKHKQLGNQNFVSRAPADVVAKERAALAALEDQLRALIAELEELRKQK